MSVTVKRRTGWVGSGSGMNILLDGQKVATVRQNGSARIDLANEAGRLSVRQLGTKSSDISVSQGDVVLVETSWFHRNSFFFIMLINFLAIFFDQLKHRLLFLGLVSLILIVVFIFHEGFRLRILPDGQTE